MHRLSTALLLVAALLTPSCCAFAAVESTMVWRIGPSGSDSNGGGYDTSETSAGTDYSQQNTAQVSGSTGSGSGTTTFTDTNASFTSALIGNAINISGQGIYEVATVPTATTLTVDRTLGTFSGASYKIGGRWATLSGNTTSSGPIQAGNTVDILGTQVCNPSSYSYDYTVSTAYAPVGGSSSAGLVRYVNDPSTPSGDLPCISIPGNWFSATSTGYYLIQGLWIVVNNSTNLNLGIFDFDTGQSNFIRECVIDLHGYDFGITPGLNGNNSGLLVVANNEVWSSVSALSTNANYAVGTGHDGGVFLWNNIHDNIGGGLEVNDAYNVVEFNIIAKNGTVGLEGLYSNGQSDAHRQLVAGNTIDDNGDQQILFDAAGAMSEIATFNNILSNSATDAAFAVTGGSSSANEPYRGFVQNQIYYNNGGGDTSNINYGPHDTHGGSNPYVGQSTENYTLK